MPTTARGAEWVLAHLSDPHLTHLEGLPAGALMNKRLLGYLSWRRRRCRVHRPEVLDALLADLAVLAPDHVAITGDLTQLGTQGEYQEAAHWLPRVGPPERVTLVPGNHDAYVAEPWQGTLALWAPYLRSDGVKEDGDPAAIFPSLRIREGIALIGLSTAVPSAPWLATGRVGSSQMEALGQLLAETGAKGLFRVLLLHHPPVPGSIQWRKRLTDAPALAALIAEQGVELVVYGHGHHSCQHWLPTPSGRAPAVGVRSASALTERPGRLAQYHVFHIRAPSSVPRLSLSVRQYAPHEGKFVTVDDRPLH